MLFDNEGVGRSRLRRGTLTVRRMGDDLSALIRSLKLRRPDVVGWSMGGMIAQSFAVRHPTQARRLGLLATVPGDGKATPPSQAALDAVRSPGLGSLTVLFPEGQTEARDSYIAHVLTRPGAVPQAPPATYLKQFTASTNWILGRDIDGRHISRLRLPVLVAGGGLDQLLPFPNQEHIAQVIPGAELVGYPGAAHGFFVQEGVSFTPKLTAFLR